MTRKLFLFILLVYCNILFSAEESILRSENSFTPPPSLEKAKPWTLGVYGLGFKNGVVVGDVNYSSYGGGIFMEPSFTNWDKKLIGFQSEYFSTGGNLSYSFFQNIIYFQIHYSFIGLSLYSKLGIGSSHIILSERGDSSSVFRGVGILESGWQNSFWENTIFRIGLRGNGILSKSGLVDKVGLQFSFGYSF